MRFDLIRLMFASVCVWTRDSLFDDIWLVTSPWDSWSLSISVL